MEMEMEMVLEEKKEMTTLSERTRPARASTSKERTSTSQNGQPVTPIS